MQNSHLVSAILDKCGEPVKNELDAFIVLNELATVLDAMNLELIQSGKGRASYKLVTIFEANTRTGTVTDPNAVDGYEEVWEVLPSGSPSRAPIPIYDDFQDLVAAEESGKRAIMFTGLKGTEYTLSWLPTAILNVELWGNRIMLTLTNATLDEESSIPDLFESLAILRATYMVLDHLLLPSVKQDYTRFVNARKDSMAIAWGQFEDRWIAFRSGIRDGNTTLRRQWYDPIEDLMAP